MLAVFGPRTTKPSAIISLGVFLLRMFPVTALAWRPSRFHVTTTALRGASASSSALQEPMAGAIDASSSSRAIFLDNDGDWIKASTTSTTSTSANIELLEALSVSELRQQAQLAGQKSTGSKKELVQRLLNQEPPGG